MPRTETNVRTLYQFNELSDSAKERARDWWRTVLGDDTDWADCVIDDAATIAGILGIDLRQRDVKLYGGGTRQEPRIYWDLGRGGGVGFDASYSYVPGSARAIREHAPGEGELHAIATRLQQAQRRYFYKLTADVSTRGSDCASITVSVYYDDEYELRPADAQPVEDAIQSFAHWIHSALTREYEYRMSDEAVDDDIRANEYEFTEEGERA